MQLVTAVVEVIAKTIRSQTFVALRMSTHHVKRTLNLDFKFNSFMTGKGVVITGWGQRIQPKFSDRTEINVPKACGLFERKAWSAGSPEMNICDFFWWNYLKEELFTHCSHHLPHVKDGIVEEMNAITYIFIVHLFKTLENVFKGVLMPTANLGALFLKLDEPKTAFADQFRYKVKISPLFIIAPRKCYFILPHPGWNCNYEVRPFST